MNDSYPDVVVAAMAELGLRAIPNTMSGTYALSEGQVVAEKFFYEGGYGVWETGEGTLKFYDETGRLLRCFGPRKSRRAAAA